MRSTGQTNRNNSYYSLPLSERQVEVLNVLERKGRLTAQEIADELSYTINRISGRLSELRDKNLIHEVGSKPGKFGKTVTVYAVIPKQAELF